MHAVGVRRRGRGLRAELLLLVGADGLRVGWGCVWPRGTNGGAAAPRLLLAAPKGRCCVEGAGAKGSIARVASAPREPQSWRKSFSPPTRGVFLGALGNP